jgi:hypothetical protein
MLYCKTLLGTLSWPPGVMTAITNHVKEYSLVPPYNLAPPLSPPDLIDHFYTRRI